MNNNTCPMCGVNIEPGVQNCPRCGFQVNQQPTKYQLGAQPAAQPVQAAQPVAQPVQQAQAVQQPVQQAIQQPQVVQQPMAYDPNTGQPIQQAAQPFSQPQNNVVVEEKPTNLYIGLGLILLGWFFAGLICGAMALSLGLSYKGKSPLKYVVMVLGGLEVLLVLISIALNFI